MTMTRRSLVVAAFGLAAAGCNTKTRTRTIPGPAPKVSTPKPPPPPVPTTPVVLVPPGRWATTPRGARWHVPAWLDLPSASALRALAEAEIDSTPPDTHPSLMPIARHGPPPGWSVIGMDPGAFSVAGSPTGLATGLTLFPEREVYVAWARPRAATGPVWPSMGHEFGHAWVYHVTGNLALATCAGHPGCTGGSTVV